MAVEPSALSETVKPRVEAGTPPVPTNLAPCCVFGAVVGLSVKVAAEVADPPAVVKDMVPVDDPGITIPTRLVPVLEMTMAAVPPIVKAVGVPRLVPVRATNVPTGPLAGLKEVITGAGIKVNPASTAVPPGVVTLTFPEVPPASTAVMLVAETTLNEFAAIPPKLTAVAPVKSVPVKVTVVPVAALVGVNEVIVGAGIKVNPASTAVPPGVVTLTSPEVPPASTAVMLVSETTVKEVAAVLPKLTAVAPVKSVPVKVTVAVEPALVGVKEVITGATAIGVALTALD
jgi:hypothetical protein